jgi:hypothetical protein
LITATTSIIAAQPITAKIMDPGDVIIVANRVLAMPAIMTAIAIAHLDMVLADVIAEMRAIGAQIHKTTNAPAIAMDAVMKIMKTAPVIAMDAAVG